MSEPIMLAQHGEWTTAIYEHCTSSKFAYRVVTGSQRRHLELETFCETLPQAKRAMAEHRRQAQEYRDD